MAIAIPLAEALLMNKVVTITKETLHETLTKYGISIEGQSRF